MTPDESKNYHQAYYYTNRAKIKEKARLRYILHGEEIKKYNREYYQKQVIINPEFIRHRNLKCKQYQKEYREKNLNKKNNQGKLEVKKGSFIITMD